MLCLRGLIFSFFLLSSNGNSIKKDTVPIEFGEMLGNLEVIEETTTASNDTRIGEDALDGKVFISNFLKKWIPHDMLWDLLNFPTVPNPEETSMLLTLEPPEATAVDLTEYNLGLYEGLLEGTLPCDCGRPLGRILNGKEARINNIPWTSALAYRDAEQPFCGATLINNKYLLTAGHCVRSTKPSEMQVWLNDENFLLSNETVGGRLVYDVLEIKKHPAYVAYFNDIALLKIDGTINLGSREEFALVNPVCLPVDAESDYAGKTGTVAGWGQTKESGKVSPALQKIKVPIWSNEECQKETKYGMSIRENMLCAGFKEGGADACQGDSGGGLIVRQNVSSYGVDDFDEEGTAVMVGIVSWGFGCGKPKAPGVYTRLSLFTKWILDNTLDAQYCQVFSKKVKI